MEDYESIEFISIQGKGIDKNVGGVSGGVKLEVILCSGEICQKKIYKIYKNGTVV